jgi:hypothetical protein
MGLRLGVGSWEMCCLWGRKERVVWGMRGTMAGNCGGFVAAETEMESGDEYFDRFNELVETFERVKKGIEESCGNWEERARMFEESGGEESLTEMPEIVRVMRNKAAWNSWKGKSCDIGEWRDVSCKVNESGDGSYEAVGSVK